MSTPTRTCPQCGGEWLYSLVFRHDPANCALRDADDSTIAADHEMDVAGSSSAFRYWGLGNGHATIRPATSTEITLATALGWPGPPTGRETETINTVLIAQTASIRRRLLLVGSRGRPWDPDTIPANIPT